MNVKNIYLDLIEAYNWLKKQKGLLTLVLILAICNFLWGFTQVLLPPMILSFTDATGLGLVESSIGLAFLFGSILSLRLSDWLQGNLKSCNLLWSSRWAKSNFRINKAKYFLIMCSRCHWWR